MVNVPVSMGIDVSLTSTGVAVATQNGDAQTELVKTSGKMTDTIDDTAIRLGNIITEVFNFAASVDPDVIVIETATFSTHKDSSAHRRAGLWWALVMVLREHWPVVGVSPTQLKKYATGKGNAPKEAVLMSVAKMWGHGVVEDGNFDRADSMVLATMGSQYLGWEVPLKLTDYRRELLKQLFSAKLDIPAPL